MKEAIKALFRNDASSARPEGSMEVYKVYWWEHNNPNGQYSSAKVHRLVDVKPNKDNLNSIEDYTITLGELPGLKCEVMDGE
jgi:CRISPR-associated protein Csd2